MSNKSKILILGLIICGFSLNSFGQKGFRLGLNLTPNISRANMLDILPDDFDRKYSPGVIGGVMAQYGLNSGIAFHLGAMYSSKSYTILNLGNEYKYDIRGSVIGLEIPLGFYLRQQMNRQSFMRELVGISAFYNMNENVKAFYRVPDENPFALESEITNRLSYSINIGVEFMREAENGNAFTLGIIYKRGLGNPMLLNVINDVNSRTPLFEMGYSGSYIGLNIGYLFNLSDLKPLKDELFFD